MLKSLNHSKYIANMPYRRARYNQLEARCPSWPFLKPEVSFTFTLLKVFSIYFQCIGVVGVWPVDLPTPFANIFSIGWEYIRANGKSGTNWRVHNALKSFDKKKFTFPHLASDFDAFSEKFNFCVSHLVDIQFVQWRFCIFRLAYFWCFRSCFFIVAIKMISQKNFRCFFFSNFHSCQTIVKTFACCSNICSNFSRSNFSRSNFSRSSFFRSSFFRSNFFCSIFCS